MLGIFFKNSFKTPNYYKMKEIINELKCPTFYNEVYLLNKFKYDTKILDNQSYKLKTDFLNNIIKNKIHSPLIDKYDAKNILNWCSLSSNTWWRR